MWNHFWHMLNRYLTPQSGTLKVKDADMLRRDLIISYIGPREVSVILKIIVLKVFSLSYEISS
jgi:hypothetical protein